MAKTFVLRTEAVRQVAIDWLSQQPLKPLIEVVARPHKSQRTTRQNRLYWRTATFAAHDIGYTVEEFHEIMLAKFFGVKVIGIGDAQLIVPRQRSKTQNSEKFSEFYNWGVAFMSTELGVRLPA